MCRSMLMRFYHFEAAGTLFVEERLALPPALCTYPCCTVLC
jgi:hypothetical protein